MNFNAEWNKYRNMASFWNLHVKKKHMTHALSEQTRANVKGPLWEAAQPRRMWHGSHYFHKKHNIYFTYYWRDCGRITSIWKQLEQLKCLVWEIQPSQGENTLPLAGMFNLAPSGHLLEKAAQDVWLRQLLLMTWACLLAYYRAISAAYHFILGTFNCCLYYIIHYIFILSFLHSMKNEACQAYQGSLWRNYNEQMSHLIKNKVQWPSKTFRNLRRKRAVSSFR